MNRFSVFALGLAILIAPASRAAEPSAADKALLEKVVKKLLAVTDAPAGFEWPPDCQVIVEPSINAYATFELKDGKKFPQIRVFSGMMSAVFRGDEDMLALVVGHEIGHIIRGHVQANTKRDRTEFLRITYGRDQELEADVTGAELMIKAGFNLKKGLKYIDQMNGLGLTYSSIEGLGADHPSWNDRLAKIDKSRERLWKSLSAFENGTALLVVEQYALAEECFDRVVKEYPDCYEAWVNLGNACLIRYFDKFDLDDIKDFDVGHVMTPGFYMRADSIPTRGRDDKLWNKAVMALTKALELNKNLTLARSNLGLAYLFHPEEKDIPKAIEFMEAAAALSPKDFKVIPIHDGTILLNLGAAYFAAGDEKKGFLNVDRALEVGRRPTRDGKFETDRAPDAARNYTVALVLSRHKSEKDNKIALSMLKRFLITTNSASIWWEAAYDQYKDLSKRLAVEAEPKESFKREVEPLRTVISHKLKSGAEVKLTDEFADVRKRLGEGLQNSVVPGSSLKRVRYGKEGVDLIVNDSVVAICVVSPDAAPITLRGKGIASTVSFDLKVGMSAEDLAKALGQGERQILTDPTVEYMYFRDQGVAIRQSRDKKVSEIVVATIPSRYRR